MTTTDVSYRLSPVADLLSFPHPVNEKAARTVAAGVLALAVLTVVTAAWWLLVPLALGFWARVLTGPTLSPLGQLATRVVAPRLGTPRYVSGPPKRFAQGMGAVISTTAAVLALSGLHSEATVVLALLIIAATLESVFGYCLGCKVFGLLMRTGVVPQEVCAECADIWAPRTAS
jgi:Domain of unknown function (DUF4395)